MKKEENIIIENQKDLEDVVIHLINNSYLLGENFDYEAEYKFVGKKDNKIIGVIAYRLQKLDNGEIVPRFIHVIISHEFRKTKTAVCFLDMTELYLKGKGYKYSIAYIKFNNKFMKKLALTYLYEFYSSDEQGEYFFKGL